ncbi:MAG TPA: hypothetical protein VJS38_18610 [Phenylobacterium sp.]|uniref:hypothetical protein n=1 Tax=Phenylobacterium sp. TaxID=1871053 RepID=UPI002B461876|nr:hypothetical protein [Phenylobacterium sp.]HKR90185.1 hypothetical protein [Phenylobacterium sp.]
MRERNQASPRALAIACAAGASVLVAVPAGAVAQAAGGPSADGAPVNGPPVMLQLDDARVAIEPYVAASSLGSRAELAARLGKLDTSLSASVERGGGGMATPEFAWGGVQTPAAWTSNDVQLKAGWALVGDTQLNLEAGSNERRTRNFPSALSAEGETQLAIDQSSFLRVHGGLHAGPLGALIGAETSVTAFDTQTPGAGAGDRQWLTTRKLFANLDWRLSQRLSLEAGQAAQNLVVGWRGASDVSSRASYLTPSVALALTPWDGASWKLQAEQTLTPINPAQFAAYAQLATPGTGTAPQPDRGWRYGVRMEHQLSGGVDLTAQVSDWRYASVTDLGPVGGGEAPVSIGPGARQELDLDLKAPLAPIGLNGTTLAGAVSLRNSQVSDPFTGRRRAFSGESPYRAELRLSGSAPVSALTWTLVASADGPQNLYQMSQVTNLGATAGLGGALTYGAGPVQFSLQLDNVIGGSRQVTTYSYIGSRTDGSLGEIDRRADDARAVRFSLKRGY